MKLHGFRELLLKKASEDQNLFALLKYVREDVLVDKVIEALEKMASNANKGAKANLSVRSFASQMDPETGPDMMRDAIGHHVSRYKAALKAGRQNLANQHAKRALGIMNLAEKAQGHSKGKLSIDYIDIKPWERHSKLNRYAPDHELVLAGERKPGEFVTDTKGLNVADVTNKFDWLNKAPHESYKGEIQAHKHNKAYPFEQVRINGKYIHVDDIDPSNLKGYEEHEFDHHPINSHHQESLKVRKPEQDALYHKLAAEYDESPHVENYFNRHSKLEEADPESYSKRGLQPSSSVHDEIPGLDLGDGESNIEAAPEKESKQQVKHDVDPELLQSLEEKLFGKKE